MADNVIIGRMVKVKISVSKVELNRLLPSGYDKLSDAVFDFPDYVMYSYKERLDKQIAYLQRLRKMSREIEKDREACRALEE